MNPTHGAEDEAMKVTVYIPTPFRRMTGNRASVEVAGATIAEVLDNLDREFPGVHDLIYSSQHEIPAHINIYVNNHEITSLNGDKTALRAGDQVAIIPAIAGGSSDGGSGNNVSAAQGGALTPEQVTRYSRHIIMPQVGSTGQRKIIGSKVVIIGAGGLGSPVALYLALAGVGTLGIVDFDVVDLTNLQRQILHQNDDIGRSKVQSAKETLQSYNPDVNVVTHETPLTSDNAMEIISQYDIVVNGADNFPARYLVNDACVFLKKPLVDGSILLFEGQATVYLPGKGCYRCLFPAPPPPGLVPSCAEAGVLGALCGLVGSIQASETLKLILGIGDSLSGRLLIIDALGMDMRTLKIRRDPKCVVCGEAPTITELIDYEAFCGGASTGANAAAQVEA
ncbi:MAG: molybdopterin-synthase adenylyltransferase MoeB [Chloroflexi bacterium]|nr:molybdopterin-synthase adenylyltransferase MoeB [Chloroflexota bacterium]